MPRESRSFSLDIDDKTFAKRSKKLLDDLGRETKPFVREQSALLARDLAKYTPPFDTFPKGNSNTVGTSKDIQKGKRALSIGLYSICHIRKRKTINWAKKAFNGGPVFINGKQIASGIIEDIATLSKWHYSNKDIKGRTKFVPPSERPFVFKTVFNKYLKIRLKDVGVAKASFYKASLHLGGKHNAVRQIKIALGKGTGKGTLKKTQKGYTGQILGLAKGAYNTKKHLPMLQKDRNIKALKRLKILASKLAKETKLNDA